MTCLQIARDAEEADDLLAACSAYAEALDKGEVGDASTAISAALTFFEAKDGGQPTPPEDAYWYFDRWIAQAAMWGAGPIADYWKAYDAHIYGDGSELVALARSCHAAGYQDALLTLAIYFPDKFASEATAFAASLRPQRTYRERYLYSILGSRFDKAD